MSSRKKRPVQSKKKTLCRLRAVIEASQASGDPCMVSDIWMALCILVVIPGPCVGPAAGIAAGRFRFRAEIVFRNEESRYPPVTSGRPFRIALFAKDRLRKPHTLVFERSRNGRRASRRAYTYKTSSTTNVVLLGQRLVRASSVVQVVQKRRRVVHEVRGRGENDCIHMCLKCPVRLVMRSDRIATWHLGRAGIAGWCTSLETSL